MMPLAAICLSLPVCYYQKKLFISGYYEYDKLSIDFFLEIYKLINSAVKNIDGLIR